MEEEYIFAYSNQLVNFLEMNVKHLFCKLACMQIQIACICVYIYTHVYIYTQIISVHSYILFINTLFPESLRNNVLEEHPDPFSKPWSFDTILCPNERLFISFKYLKRPFIQYSNTENNISAEFNIHTFFGHQIDLSLNRMLQRARQGRK